MKSAFITLFPDFNASHVYKDVGMIPLIMANEYGFDSYILCENSFARNQGEHEDISFLTIKSKKNNAYSLFNVARCILRIAKNYDRVVVNYYHYRTNHLLLSFILKVVLKNVVTYLKMDINIDSARRLFSSTRPYLKPFRDYFLRYIDVISAETMSTFNVLCEIPQISSKLHLIPNGVFTSGLDINGDIESIINNKEKIVFSAGRLESYQKNTPLLIDSFLASNLWQHEWKLVLAGSFDKELKDYAEARSKEIINNDSANVISFTGHLNRAQLFRYMKRSRIFALSSRWEGFALILPEAAAHGCILVATDVGGVEDITKMGSLGLIAKEHSVSEFSKALKNAANHVDAKTISRLQMDFCLSKFDWKVICKDLMKIINEKN